MNFSKISLTALSAIFAMPGSIHAHIPPHPQSLVHPLHETHNGLELYSKNGVFNTINHTQTAAGMHALRDQLALPITDTQALCKRQSAIKHLCNNVPLQKTLSEIIQSIATLESTHSRAPIDQKVIDTLLFTWPALKELNYNPYVLTGLAYTYPLMDFVPVATHTLMPLIASYLGINSNCCSGHGAKKAHAHTHARSNQCAQGVHGSHQKHNTHPLTYVLAGLTALHAKEIATAPIRWYNTPSRYADLQRMHTQLQIIAQRFAHIKRLYAALQNDPEFFNSLTEWHSLKNFATKTNISAKLKQLLELLESNTFKGEFSRLIKAGNVLVAYQLLQEIGDELSPVNKALGEIDMYLGCAKLVQEHNYRYAQYVDSEKPFIEAKNFTHPFITQDAVENSLTVDRNALFSGPSTSGKSTALKSLGLSCYLAQTLGIALADLTMTPFDVIVALRDIKDNTQEGRSKFENVALKLHNILTQARECCAQNKRMLVVLDDGIDGINSEVQERVISNFLQTLLPLPNVVVVAVTHCKAATEVAEAAACECKNYTFVNHRLVPGIGQFDVATELLERKHPELRTLLHARA